MLQQPLLWFELAWVVFAVWFVSRERLASTWVMVGVASLILGLGMMAWTVQPTWFPTESQYLAEHGREAVGSITRITKSSTDKTYSDTRVLAADVQYDTPSGPVTVNLDLRNSIGQGSHSDVWVVYDPADPAKALPVDVASAPSDDFEWLLRVLGTANVLAGSGIVGGVLIARRRSRAVQPTA